MPGDSARPSRGLLEPMDRFSEVLFGLIMVLTFTGSLSAAEAGRAEVRTMLIGALGCNLAWGIVDGVMFLMARLSERWRGLLALRALRGAADAEQAQGIIAEALPPLLASVLRPPEYEMIRKRLNELPHPPSRVGLSKRDWLAAGAVALLVFLSTLPVVVPFVFIGDAWRALRVSNGVAIVMLFVAGWGLGRYAGRRPWLVGLCMVVIGIVLVGLTMALGG